MHGARSVWQISAGALGRSYADEFLKYAVALMPPGDSGPWTASRSDSEFDDSMLVRRFATELAPDDIVLLRSGQSTVVAVGVVAGPYFYWEAFDDVNGFDLQHARRVRWYRLPTAHRFRAAVFGAMPQRLSKVWNKDALTFAYSFVSSDPREWQYSALPELPHEEGALDEIPHQLGRIVARVADLMPLYGDQAAFGEPPYEDELVAHFIVPFVRALGWPPERTGIKWRRVDVALFDSLPRSPSTCRYVIEAKRLGVGVEGALKQAADYVLALESVSDIIVTDGVRYRMYSGLPPFSSLAYANLLRLKIGANNLFSRLRAIGA